MCSWCWGIAPALSKLQDLAQNLDIDFEIRVGGLRTGGGEPWNQQMKDFLKHHWEQVHEASGQVFNYDLLARDAFNYDTEPACRLVVASRKWLGINNLAWFTALQRRFYVDSKDLADLANIKPLCDDFDLNYQAFREHFNSEKVKQQTLSDFQTTRSWGVQGYPYVLLHDEGRLIGLAQGSSPFEKLQARLQEYLSQKTSV